MRKYLFLLMIACGLTSIAQVTTTKVTPLKDYSASNGTVYALPKTSFRIDVWVEKAEHIKGPYAIYAKKLLGLETIIDFNSKSYSLKNVAIDAEIIADPEQLYFINLGENSDKSDNIKYLQINESGLFGGISATGQTSAIENKNILIEEIIKGNKNFRYFADANLIEKTDTIIRRVDIDTSHIEKAIIKKYSVEKDMLQRAQDAATTLMEIRKNRFELISGYQEVAYSAGTMEIMNDELKQMEDDYLALFAGKTVLTDEHYVFYYSPAADQPNIIAPVFKFSDQSGVDYLSGSGGEKISLAIKSSGLAENMADISTNSVVDGVVYRFPETAEVWVKYGSKEYDKQLMAIPQFGKLQKIHFNQNVMELHPTTGGLKLLEVRK